MQARALPQYMADALGTHDSPPLSHSLRRRLTSTSTLTLFAFSQRPRLAAFGRKDLHSMGLRIPAGGVSSWLFVPVALPSGTMVLPCHFLPPPSLFNVFHVCRVCVCVCVCV